MTQFRPHRRLLADAMAEVTIIDSLEDLVRVLRQPVESWYPKDKLPTVDTIKIEPYGRDDRIGWDTYIVTSHGEVWGFTDGPLIKKEPPC